MQWKICDRQNFLLNGNKFCGFFSLKSSRSNIISMHSICFSTETSETKMMSKFLFLKKLETLKKGNLSENIHASRLQSGNDAYDDIVDDFEKIVDLDNSEGGWTVYEWVKRGLINDVSILVNDIKEPCDNKVLSQEISTRVVHLHPPKKDYPDLSTIHNRYLENIKFEFSTL